MGICGLQCIEKRQVDCSGIGGCMWALQRSIMVGAGWCGQQWKPWKRWADVGCSGNMWETVVGTNVVHVGKGVYVGGSGGLEACGYEATMSTRGVASKDINTQAWETWSPNKPVVSRHR